MRRKMSWAVSLLALGLWIVPVGSAVAGDANTSATGNMSADDANQGTGAQVNADNWEFMNNAMAGSGNQNSQVYGNANTGSGSQNNSDSVAFEWFDMINANAGTGAQVLESSNSNGRDRDSSDVVFELGAAAGVANSALDASVTGNSVTVSDGGSVGSEFAMGDGSGFSEMYGVSAVAASAGANASQNVSVNVTAQVQAATP